LRLGTEFANKFIREKTEKVNVLRITERRFYYGTGTF